MITRSKNQILLTIALIFVLAAPVGIVAAAADYANTAAIFDLGVGARTMGMGGAFIGLSDDENAALYNPAGLAFLDGAGINTSYNNRFDALTYNSAVGAVKSFGIAGMSLSSGMFDVTDEYGVKTGEVTSYSSSALVGSFGINGDMVGLGSAAKNLGIGLQIRSFNSSLHTTEGSGFSLSLSSLYRTQIDENTRLQLGIIIPSVVLGQFSDPGFPLGKITYENSDGGVVHEEKFPNNFGLGVGLNTVGLIDQGLNISLDWRAQGGIRGGLEHLFPLGAVRFGVTGSGILSAGAGLRLANLGSADFLEQIRIDGVYQWHPDLDNSYLFSFSARI